jgi:hypothetical protein
MAQNHPLAAGTGDALAVLIAEEKIIPLPCLF